jgi:predicted DCC family thiol-disulfide oxidoreductase YuxK
LIIPWPWRDFVYQFVADHRYLWFGKRDSCRIPTPFERAQFLD